MKEGEVLCRLAKYYEFIKRIGRLPLSKELHSPDLGNDEKATKNCIQNCYLEMKKDRIKVSIIDYLCQLSTLYLLIQSGVDYKKILSLYSTNNREEVRNFIRYFMKNPRFFLKGNNPKVFHEIADFWYQETEKEREGQNI